MRSLLTAAVLCLALPAAGRGQSFEITPVGGYRFGGSFDGSSEGADRPGRDFELDDAASFGLHLGYRTGDGEIELIYVRQGTRLQSADLFAGQPIFELAVETWQLGGSYFFGEDDARLVPYVGLGLGLTRLIPEPAGLDDETRFAASVAGGAKLWLGRHVGLRFEARGIFTVMGSDSGSFCGSGSCVVFVGTSDVIAQVDLHAGLILRF